MDTVRTAAATLACCLTFLSVAQAQCNSGPPPPPPSGGTWTASSSNNPNPAGPSGPAPASPSSPGPAGPSAPVPESPSAGPVTPRGPMPGLRAGGRTGGMAMTFERGETAKDRLRVDWVHPVPPSRSTDRTEASGPLPLDKALALLWETGDDRPLLVMRECAVCKDGDDALLSRSLNNDRTMLLTKWFRTVRLPAHVVEPSHPFYGVFASYTFKEGLPHFFLLAHPGAAPVRFTGQQTQAQLVKGLCDVLEQRYAKDPLKAVKQWLSVLDAFDAIDSRSRQLRDQLDATRAAEGPDSEKAKKMTEALARLAVERDEALTRETRIRDLGLLPMPRAATVASK